MDTKTKIKLCIDKKLALYYIKTVHNNNTKPDNCLFAMAKNDKNLTTLKLLPDFLKL